MRHNDQTLIPELLAALTEAMRERDAAIESRRFWFRRWNYAVTGEHLVDDPDRPTG